MLSGLLVYHSFSFIFIHLAFSWQKMHAIQCAAEVPWRTSRNKPSCCRTEYLGEASHHHIKNLFPLNYKSWQLSSRFPPQNQVQTPTKASMFNRKSAARLLHLSWEQVHLAALARLQDIAGYCRQLGTAECHNTFASQWSSRQPAHWWKTSTTWAWKFHQSKRTEMLFGLLRLDWVCMRCYSLGGKPVWYNVNNEYYPTVCEWKDFTDQESSKRPWILTHQSKVRIIRLGTGWFFHCRGIVERMLQTSSKVHTLLRRKNMNTCNFSPGTNIPSLPALISLVCAAIALGPRQNLYWKLCLSLQCPFPCHIKPVVCQAFVEPANLEFHFGHIGRTLTFPGLLCVRRKLVLEYQIQHSKPNSNRIWKH